MPHDAEWMTLKEAAAEFNLSQRQVRRLISQKKLTATKKRNKVYVPAKEVHALKKQREEKQSGQVKKSEVIKKEETQTGIKGKDELIEPKQAKTETEKEQLSYDLNSTATESEQEVELIGAALLGAQTIQGFFMAYNWGISVMTAAITELLCCFFDKPES